MGPEIRGTTQLDGDAHTGLTGKTDSGTLETACVGLTDFSLGPEFP